MPEDPILLLERRHPETIEAQVGPADGPNAQIGIMT